MRFLFVHGTGVRRDQHEKLSGRVRKGLLERFPDAEVSSCFWGERFGASLSAGGRSVPGMQQTRGMDDGVLGSAVAPPDREVAEWALLLADPLCELQVLAEAGWDDGDGLSMPGVQPAGAEVLARLGDLPTRAGPDDELGALLRETGLYGHYAAALTAVADSEAAMDAGDRAVEQPAARELAGALARAVVAAALSAAGDEADCTGEERDRLTELLLARLGGDARWPGERATAFLGRLAMRVTTQPALNVWRGPITLGVTPPVGDILRYQTRGQALREYLAQHLRELFAGTGSSGPTVLIGHSLGGIALVDTLAMDAARGGTLPQPQLLVTVGSQAPYLYELGALCSIAPGDPLPDGFPRWLNIYDRQDLLAFLAEPVFPGSPQVTDHEVSSRQPFPVSHSAYWKLDSVYDRIAHAMAECT